jgi:hypothetical protein
MRVALWEITEYTVAGMSGSRERRPQLDLKDCLAACERLHVAGYFGAARHLPADSV